MNSSHQQSTLTRAELARELGVSIHTVNQWAVSGKGPKSIRVGRQCVYLRVDVDRYKASLAKAANHEQAVSVTSLLPAGAYIMRLPDVTAITGLSKSSIYSLSRKNLFPAAISLGPRAVGWPSHLVHKWLADRINSAQVAA